MPLRADKGSISRYGKLIVDIANSHDSELAIHSYFEGIKSIFNFSPNFSAEVSDLYPSLAKAHALLTPNDLELISHITRESKLLSNLDTQLGSLGYVLEDYDPDNNSLRLNTFEYIYEGVSPDGHPEVTTTYESPYFIKVCNLRDEIDSLPYAQDIFRDLESLMEIGCDIKKLKENASIFLKNAPKPVAQRYEEIKNLHKKIDEMQLDYRSILDSIIENKNLSEIPAFLKYLRSYNFYGTKFLSISTGYSLIETPLIREQDYLVKRSCMEWERILEIGYIYIIVEFIKSGFAYLLIRKCIECKKFYLAMSARESKYCSGKCRAKFHNRNRILSGEHREYKRKKRREGAKESYYG